MIETGVLVDGPKPTIALHTNQQSCAQTLPTAHHVQQQLAVDEAGVLLCIQHACLQPDNKATRRHIVHKHPYMVWSSLQRLGMPPDRETLWGAWGAWDNNNHSVTTETAQLVVWAHAQSTLAALKKKPTLKDAAMQQHCWSQYQPHLITGTGQHQAHWRPECHLLSTVPCMYARLSPIQTTGLHRAQTFLSRRSACFTPETLCTMNNNQSQPGLQCPALPESCPFPVLPTTPSLVHPSTHKPLEAMHGLHHTRPGGAEANVASTCKLYVSPTMFAHQPNKGGPSTVRAVDTRVRATSILRARERERERERERGGGQSCCRKK